MFLEDTFGSSGYSVYLFGARTGRICGVQCAVSIILNSVRVVKKKENEGATRGHLDEGVLRGSGRGTARGYAVVEEIPQGET